MQKKPEKRVRNWKINELLNYLNRVVNCESLLLLEVTFLCCGCGLIQCKRSSRIKIEWPNKFCINFGRFAFLLLLCHLIKLLVLQKTKVKPINFLILSPFWSHTQNWSEFSVQPSDVVRFHCFGFFFFLVSFSISSSSSLWLLLFINFFFLHSISWTSKHKEFRFHFYNWCFHLLHIRYFLLCCLLAVDIE